MRPGFSYYVTVQLLAPDQLPDQTLRADQGQSAGARRARPLVAFRYLFDVHVVILNAHPVLYKYAIARYAMGLQTSPTFTTNTILTLVL